MKKKNILVYFVLVFLFAFSFKLGTVQALFTSGREEALNVFTIASPYTDTYSYVYRANNGRITNLGEKTVTAFAGQIINIDAPNVDVSNYILDSITINGNGSYNIGDTYTQPNSDLTILYTYRQKNTYRVTFSGNNYTHTGANNAQILEGDTYTTTLTPSNNYTITGATITMGGRTLTQGIDYTFEETNNGGYIITIAYISGNITIAVTTERNTCLGEGTQIMLWDGSTKNIEDIRYNDLLLVWNHDTGTYGYEYPAWIEKAGTTDHYTKVTFSDGSELKVVVDHRVFSKRLNKYVNILSGELNIGDEVVSLKDGVSYVSIVSFEEINEEIKYYNIITTRYFNYIADGLLVTYELYDEISSNYKGFDSNMKWMYQTPEEEMISYEEMISMFGYVDKYLYKTLKLYDFKYAVEQGYISQEELMSIIEEFMMNTDYRLEVPVSVSGKYLWMVTTSDSSDPTNKGLLLEDGSIYVAPTPDNEEGFLYWYNSSDNKYYSPGDEIVVDSSMYLQAIYGEPEIAEEVIEPEEIIEEVVEETTEEELDEHQEELVEQEETTDSVIVEETADPKFWEITEFPLKDDPEGE